VRGDEPGESAAFDHAVKELATGASRRSIVRGLAAGLIAAAGGGIASSAVAKKRKKRKKGKVTPQSTPQPTPAPRPQSACAEVTTIGFVSVRSDGSVVETPVLQKGQIYHLRADGWWGEGGEYATDAYARFRFAAPSEHTLFDRGTRVGLSVNDNSPDLWGNRPDSYTTSHRYTMAVVGKGAPATLRMVDVDYSNNHRELTVEVVCIPT
jgi:hypothetical protein